MASQENLLLRSPPRNTPSRTAGVDFEVAESLLQHSRGVREASGDKMPIPTQESTTDLSPTNEVGAANGAKEHGRGDRQSNSQERQSDAQYAPISNPPALGQACR